MLPRQITSFVFAPLWGAVLFCASSADAASVSAQTQTKDHATEVRSADEGQWKRVPGGSRPAYAGIQGGTVPVSLLQASNGTIFVIPGRTGNDFTHVLRGTNGTPDNATQAAKPAAKPVAQSANATQPEGAPTAQAAPHPEAAKTVTQTANATQATPPAAQAVVQPETAKPVAQTANATQPVVAPTAQPTPQPEAAPVAQAAPKGEPTPTAQVTDTPEAAKPVAQADTAPKAENPAPQPTATPAPQAVPQPEAAPAAQAAPTPEAAPTAQAAGKPETTTPVAQTETAPKAADPAVPQPEAAKPVAQADTAPKAESSAPKLETAQAAQSAPTQALAAVQAQAEPAPASQGEHVVFASADLAARLHEEQELAPFGLTADATEVERPVQLARPVKPTNVAVFKPLRLGSYKAVLAKR